LIEEMRCGHAWRRGELRELGNDRGDGQDALPLLRAHVSIFRKVTREKLQGDHLRDPVRVDVAQARGTRPYPPGVCSEPINTRSGLKRHPQWQLPSARNSGLDKMSKRQLGFELASRDGAHRLCRCDMDGRLFDDNFGAGGDGGDASRRDST